jgi:large conductance mechanosensitive channel
LRQEFKQFLKSYAILGVAIGIVIGQAAAKVITNIVGGLVMPILELVLPGSRWQEAVVAVGRVDIKLGLIVAALLDFFIVSVAVFFLVRYVLRVSILQK